MLHTTTVEPHTLALLKDLMQKSYIKPFVLVGGTALALQIGHRQSIDLDMFTLIDFSSDELLETLKADYEPLVIAKTPQSLITNIEKVKVDFIRFKYPFIRPLLEDEGVRMLSIEDIAPMKLDAIAGRGSKKDFYDIYFLLQRYSLPQLLGFYTEKYNQESLFHVIRSLVYFEDAEPNPEPLIFDKKVTWKKVKKEITKQVKSL